MPHLRESLFTSAPASPCSQTGGCLTALAFIGQPDVVCCQIKNIDQIPLNNHFPAQSLHLRYGSAAPCPTLRTNVTTSFPRTRYGRVANPYPTGLSCCEVISLQRPFAQPVENRGNPIFAARTDLVLYRIPNTFMSVKQSYHTIKTGRTITISHAFCIILDKNILTTFPNLSFKKKQPNTNIVYIGIRTFKLPDFILQNSLI